MDAATKSQNASADPTNSTWLSANAGSGKTRVLTDRVARLLLRGVEPQNVLCLTYTKAAASEMQNRLFGTLGSWAMVSDAELRKKLRDLGEEREEDLAGARRLFAKAIEAPGGLKIQTIHSFCSAVLRQFPLEAGVTPQFRELDEDAQKALIEDVLDALAYDPATTGVARFYSDQSLVSLGVDVAGKRLELAKALSRDQVFRLYGVPAGCTTDDIVRIAFKEGDWAFLEGTVSSFRHSGVPAVQAAADAITESAGVPSITTLKKLEDSFLYKEKSNAPFAPKLGRFPDKPIAKSPEFAAKIPKLETIMQQVSYARNERIKLEAAEKTAALHAFASVFLPAYEKAKSDRGLLDFDDLIHKTKTLLSDRSLAWVLYRIDGSIDHILIDEAQDTSPLQWDVITALSDEITSGQGSRENEPRSLFVVGDKKQSIYSFQGADADGFDRMSATLEAKLKDGAGLKQHQLLHSFRSSPAILRTVDAVFNDPLMRGVGENIAHIAFHEQKPGRVDLWDLVPNSEDTDDLEWHDPSDRIVDSEPAVVLAKRLAGAIRRMIETETIQEKNGDIRRIEPKDILILVQGRSEIFDQIISACKAANLPMAGADRLKLGGVLAVKDLLALLSFLALPEDSLSLAAALKSPLFGWSEQDLYGLAQGRKQPVLWAELRNRAAEYTDTMTILNDLRNVVDHLRPYELLERILSRHHGRSNLTGRLGPEAEDGIDELLNQALVYERDAVPSLTDFLVKAQSEEIEVKRQLDSTGNMIRVMTVHGAKGLESPIVFLPDTTPGARVTRNEILVDSDDGMPIWPVSNAESPDRVKKTKDAKKEADKRERNRLLYVAMTRAESWLIVCGKAPPRNAGKSYKTWHEIVGDGLKRAGASQIETEDGRVLRLAEGHWPTPMVPRQLPRIEATPVEAPQILTTAAPAPTPTVAQVSPSDLGGAKVLGGGAMDEAAALKRGRQIHLLFEHLPKNPDQSHAERLLSEGPDQADPIEVAALFAEVQRSIDAHPQLFDDAALAEVDVCAFLPVLSLEAFGTIDRLLIRDDRITVVDFKTNALVPDHPEAVPEGLLRQMGAYLEALEQIWTDRPIEVAILWTASADLMMLPHGIVRAALQRATTS